MYNIRFFGFARESSSAPIVGYALETGMEQKLKEEVAKVLGRLREL